MAAPDLHFRYAFIPIWRLQTTICTAAILAVWVLLSFWLDRPLTRPGLLTSLSTSASCAVALGLVIALARFRVGPEGLRTFNSWGHWRRVPWEAIERVEPGRYYFLPHLRLTVDGYRTKHWVPLFLRDMGGFRQAVAQAAGAQHPLARALPVPASAAQRRPPQPNPVSAALDLQLRPATPDDALCLSVLAMQVFLDTYATEGIRPAIAREVLAGYSAEVFSADIAAARTRIVVAERQGHLIGFAQLTLGASEDLAPPGVQAELLHLYVQEPFTARGVGTALLAQAEAVAIATGATVLWLTPWVHNHRARAFYAARGYTDFGTTLFRFEGEAHENRVVAKHLSPQEA